MTATIDPQVVFAAAARLAGGVLRTSTERSRVLSDVVGGEVYLKIECRQVTGAFKERGALNALAQLDPACRARGVVTMSAGNHAQGLAYHAGRLGIPALVVMPEGTPFLKVRRTRDYGAQVVLRGESFEEASDYARERAAATGSTLIHPYDDLEVIAGQATATLELLQDVPDLEVLLVPVGGGGLAAGAVLAAQALGSAVEIVGVQSESYPALYGALNDVPIEIGDATIAEGIAVRAIGAIPLAILRGRVRDVLLVSEPALETAIGTLIEDEKLVTEGAGAAGVAALQTYAGRFAGKKVGTILCGGNIDLGMLAAVIVRARMRSGRVVRISVRLIDKPGGLVAIASAVADAGANVLDVVHHRMYGSVPAKYAELALTCELQRADDLNAILEAIAARGYEAVVLAG